MSRIESRENELEENENEIALVIEESTEGEESMLNINTR